MTEHANYARVTDGVVVETVVLPDGILLSDAFHAEIVSAMVACDNDVAVRWVYDGATFSPPSATVEIHELRAQRIAALTADCAAAIVGGYVSSTLGAPHTYPSGVTDQINMMGSVTASLLPDIAPDWSTPFWCADSAGAWSFRMHGVVEIQQAGADGKAHVVQCQSILQGLTAAVMAAETAEAVAAIVWPES